MSANETAERIATLGGSPKGTPGAVVEERTWDDKMRSAWRTEAVNQLYNLDEDAAEKNNVFEKQPEVAKRLKALLDKYRDQGFSRPMA